MLPILVKAYESTPAHSTTVRRCSLFLCHSDTSLYTVMVLKLQSWCELLLADSTWEGLTIGRVCEIEYSVHFWQYTNNINCRHLQSPLHCIFATSLLYLITWILHCYQFSLLFYHYHQSSTEQVINLCRTTGQHIQSNHTVWAGFVFLSMQLHGNSTSTSNGECSVIPNSLMIYLHNNLLQVTTWTLNNTAQVARILIITLT